MDTNKTENYIPHLHSSLHGYNNSTHSTIGISPNLAWNDNSLTLKLEKDFKNIIINFVNGNLDLRLVMLLE